MNVTILFGSPRRNGNTKKLVDYLIEGLKKKGHEIKVLYINDLNIRPCQGCLKCLKEGDCTIKDDMKDVRKYVLDSDLLIFASPVYWFSISGQLKLVIDRMMAFMDQNYNSRIKGKSAITVMTSGAAEKDVVKPSLMMFEKTFDLLGLNYIGHLEARGCDERKDAITRTKKEVEKLLRLL
ncbi:MAG: flavodoxin family protein [Deltaproteobacteria bacterium]|nr:flavodoxin family protein [Deltaproteobacteria bacterium]